MHFDVTKLQISGPTDLQGMLGLLLHGVVRNGGKEQPDAVEGDIFQIALRMSQDDAGAIATSNDVANQHIANRSNGLHRKFRNTRMDLTATLDVEMEGFSVSPPEPVMELGLDGEVRQDHIAYVTVVKIHESNAAVGAGDDTIIHRNFADRVAIAVAKLQSTRGRGNPA